MMPVLDSILINFPAAVVRLAEGYAFCPQEIFLKALFLCWDRDFSKEKKTRIQAHISDLAPYVNKLDLSDMVINMEHEHIHAYAHMDTRKPFSLEQIIGSVVSHYFPKLRTVVLPARIIEIQLTDLIELSVAVDKIAQLIPRDGLQVVQAEKQGKLLSQMCHVKRPHRYSQNTHALLTVSTDLTECCLYQIKPVSDDLKIDDLSYQNCDDLSEVWKIPESELKDIPAIECQLPVKNPPRRGRKSYCVIS